MGAFEHLRKTNPHEDSRPFQGAEIRTKDRLTAHPTHSKNLKHLDFNNRPDRGQIPRPFLIFRRKETPKGNSIPTDTHEANFLKEIINESFPLKPIL